MMQSYLPTEAKHSLASLFPVRPLFCIAEMNRLAPPVVQPTF
jgi:hypothetical protein